MTTQNPSTLPHSSLYRAEAIILRHRDLGEADRIITLFSREHGKLRVSARGVRKLKSRLGGHVEPLIHASFLLVRGRTLDIVSQAQALETFPHIRGDLLTTTRGLYVAELVDLFSQEHEAQPALFSLLLEALHRLEGGAPGDALLRAFEVGVLEVAGYRPVLDRCASCGRAIDSKERGLGFGAALGGAVCSSCRTEQWEAMRPLSSEALAALRLLQQRGLDAAEDPMLDGEGPVGSELEALLRWHLRYILERPVETVAFLDQLRTGRTP